MDLVDIVCFFVPTYMLINIVIIASVGSPQILLCVHAQILLCLEHVFRVSENSRMFFAGLLLLTNEYDRCTAVCLTTVFLLNF